MAQKVTLADRIKSLQTKQAAQQQRAERRKQIQAHRDAINKLRDATKKLNAKPSKKAR